MAGIRMELMLKIKFPKLDSKFDGELEKEYHSYFLKRDIRQSTFIIALLVILTGAFAYNDFQLAGKTVLVYLILFRILFVSSGIFLWMYIRNCKTLDKAGLFLGIWGALGISLFIFVNFARPVDVSIQLIISMITIFAIYISLIGSIAFRAIPALILTLGIILIMIFGESSTKNFQVSTIITALAVNIIGLLSSQHFSSSRRKQFITNKNLLEQISERGKVEYELKESRDKYQSLIETTSDFIWEMDSQGRYTYCSPQAKILWGLDTAQMLGKTPFDMIPPGAREGAIRIFMELARAGRPFTGLEAVSFDSKNNLIKLEINGVPFFDKKGTLAGYRGVTRDITERKKAEETLVSSEKKFRRVFETSRDVLYMTSIDGQILEASRSAEIVLGYTLEELKHMNAMALYADPGFRSNYTDQLAQNGFIDNFEIKFRRKDGRLIDIALTAVPVKDVQGNIIGTQGSFRDITEHKKAEIELQESERKFRELAEMLPVVVFETDIRGKLTFANDKAFNLFGNRDLEKQQINIFDYVAMESKEQAIINVQKVITGEKVGPSEYTFVKTDGRLLRGLISSSVIKNNQESVIGIRGILVDITERKQAEEQLRTLYEKEKNLREELQEEAKARGMFINVLGHELRTPLTPLIASTGMLKEILNENGQGIENRLINNVYTSALTLGERLEELLDLARISRGTFTIRKQTVDLTILISRLVNGYKVMAERQNKVLKAEMNICALEKIEADPARLEQVINNLLSNALKYTPANSTVSLSVYRADTEMIIEVRDQGIGIDPENQKKLFQPYHRVEQDRQTYPGIGLGLAVCKQIIDAHGGKIIVESEVGKGSNFIVSLPIKDKQEKVSAVTVS
jgi:PAS domain S-box-containing protein